MVQIIQGKSLGSSLAQGIGQGAAEGYSQALQRRHEKELMAGKEDAKLKNKLSLLVAAGVISEDQAADLLSKGVINPSNEMAGKLAPKSPFSESFQGNEEQSQGNPQENSQHMEPSLEEQERKELGLSLIDPAYGRQKTEQRNIRGKEKRFAHSSTSKYATELEQSAKNAEEIKFATSTIRNAIRSGKTGLTAQNMAYSYLSDAQSPIAGAFQSKEAGKFNVAMKTLASGFKKIMGAKPTEREFFWYENILPGLLKSAPTNEAILDYFDHLADMDIEAQNIHDEIVKENGGYRPIDIDSQVRKRMKPILNQAINEGYALSGEFDSQEKVAKGKEKTVYTEMPPAKSNKGKILTNEDDGKRYKSDGNEWVPLNG